MQTPEDVRNLPIDITFSRLGGNRITPFCSCSCPFRSIHVADHARFRSFRGSPAPCFDGNWIRRPSPHVCFFVNSGVRLSCALMIRPFAVQNGWSIGRGYRPIGGSGWRRSEPSSLSSSRAFPRMWILIFRPWTPKVSFRCLFFCHGQLICLSVNRTVDLCGFHVKIESAGVWLASALMMTRWDFAYVL